MLFTTASAILAFTTLTSAHMIMKTPIPYDKATLNSSPLEGTGADFPCKHGAGVPYNAAGADNVFPLGSTQSLSFTGSAVHGGGSCQVSITYDSPPTKASVWKVILSIEGGCPANTAGNLPADPNGNGADKFQFQIPNEMPQGKATLAWTWFNRIGNREMYMNCAPVTLGSGSAKRAESNTFYTSLPDMFVANIGNQCATKESVALAFPNPGMIVQKHGSGPTGPPVGTCPKGSGPVGPAVSSPAVSSPAVPTSTPTGQVFAPGATPLSSSTLSTSTHTTQAVATPSPVDGDTTPVQPKPTPVSTGSVCDASNVGKSLCNGTSKIGMCDAQGQVIWIQVAQGTVCRDGYMVFPGSAVKARNAKRFVREHARAHHGFSF